MDTYRRLKSPTPKQCSQGLGLRNSSSNAGFGAGARSKSSPNLGLENSKRSGGALHAWERKRCALISPQEAKDNVAAFYHLDSPIALKAVPPKGFQFQRKPPNRSKPTDLKQLSSGQAAEALSRHGSITPVQPPPQASSLAALADAIPEVSKRGLEPKQKQKSKPQNVTPPLQVGTEKEKKKRKKQKQQLPDDKKQRAAASERSETSKPPAGAKDDSGTEDEIVDPNEIMAATINGLAEVEPRTVDYEGDAEIDDEEIRGAELSVSMNMEDLGLKREKSSKKKKSKKKKKKSKKRKHEHSHEDPNDPDWIAEPKKSKSKGDGSKLRKKDSEGSRKRKTGGATYGSDGSKSVGSTSGKLASENAKKLKPKKMIQSAPTETLQADFKKSLKQREKEKERQPQPDRRKSNYGMSASKLADLKERLNKGKRKVVSPISDPSMLSKKAEPSPSPPPMPTLNALSTSAVPDNKEALKASSLWSLGVHDSLPPLKRPLKRARVRKRTVGDSSIVGGLDLSCPESTVTNWNASEVIKNFLYIGAGRDQNHRCLVNRPYDTLDIKTEECIQMKIDMNDVDSWGGDEMEEGFEKGARFIQDAWEAHKAAKEKNRKLSHAGSNVTQQPPRVFVHCVAGVNRSPMVAVWWLVKYHGLFLRDAWELVRKRRDSGAHWKDVALGGRYPPDDYFLDPNEYNGDRPAREFQHPIAAPSSSSSSASKQTGSKSSSASGGRPAFPKGLWFKHAAKILQPYFKRRWHESDIKSPPRSSSSGSKPPPPPPPQELPPNAEAANTGKGGAVESRSLSSSTGEKAAGK